MSEEKNKLDKMYDDFICNIIIAFGALFIIMILIVVVSNYNYDDSGREKCIEYKETDLQNE